MRVGLRPIHSVKTITWGSERSGMASSFTRRMAATDPTRAKATASSTRSRLRAQSSMIFSTMAASARVALDGRAELALGVEQEVAGRHHHVALGQPGQDLHPVAHLPAHLHRARLEVPAPGGHEHVLVL